MTDLPHLYCVFGTSDGKLVPRSDLNRALALSDGRPLILPERAVDDAAFHMSQMRDPRVVIQLREFRDQRRRVIEAYFQQCAEHVLQKIEEREEWAKFGMGRHA